MFVPKPVTENITDFCRYRTHIFLHFLLIIGRPDYKIPDLLLISQRFYSIVKTENYRNLRGKYRYTELK